MNGNPGPSINRMAIIHALETVSENIGGDGVAFLFASHGDMHLAKQNLSNLNHPGE